MLLVLLIVGIVCAIIMWVRFTTPPPSWHQLQRWRRDEDKLG
jgi:uncharacterized protein (DUF983 family)